MSLEDEVAKMRGKMDENDKIEDEVSRKVSEIHFARYFSATDEERREIAKTINEAETSKSRILADATLPAGEWNSKWPPGLRAAIRALFNTPKD